MFSSRASLALFVFAIACAKGENAKLHKQLETARKQSVGSQAAIAENAQLRAEIGSIKDRLETMERIVTDQPHRLSREIDALAIDKGGNA